MQRILVRGAIAILASAMFGPILAEAVAVFVVEPVMLAAVAIPFLLGGIYGVSFLAERAR